MMNEKKGKFKALAADMLPVIERMNAVLEKHGVEKLASVTMSTDGYFSFYTHETAWEMIRVSGSDTAKITYSFSEDI